MTLSVIIGIVVLVVFIIAAVLAVLMILVQDEQGDSIGGIFGATNNAISRSGNILTRTTGILVGIFFVAAIVLIFIYTSGNSSNLAKTVLEEKARNSMTAETLWSDQYTKQGMSIFDKKAATDVAPSTDLTIDKLEPSANAPAAVE
jgi:preprotein translocase subunit SecG